ncbi:MAG TPA: hypothetical protein VER32_13535 [Pyrinomonadaceae bacterium]|nr:hypothetical protein [Pyrinomonadaceae bacterium]
MIDMGGIAARVRDTFDVVGRTVEQASSTVARLFRDDVQPTRREADVVLHRVAARVQTNLTPEERQQVERDVEAVFQRAGHGYAEAAIELAKRLRGESSDYQAAVTGRLFDVAPGVAADVLRGAGGERHHISEGWPTESDQYLIARSLGAAYDRGHLPSDFVEQLLGHDSMFLPPNNEFTGTIVGMSGSQDLVNAYVDRSLELARGDEPDWIQSFNLGAARAMAGDPKILQQRLEAMTPEQLTEFLSRIEPRWHDTKIAGYDSGYTNALASVVRGAADIQPPTEQVLNLFREVATKYMDRAGVADAMGELFTSGYTEHVRFANGRIDESVFHSNAEFFLHRMLATGKDPVTGRDIDEAGQVAALRNFVQATAFSDYSEYRDGVRAQLTEQIRTLQSAIQYYPGVGSRTESLIARTIEAEPGVDRAASIKEQLAFRLGRLTATVFQGFEAAVKARNGENAAIDGTVDFLFGLVPVSKATDIVKARIPGAGLVIDKAADKGVDTLKGIVKDWLHKADLEDQRLEVWNLYAEFANNVATYHSGDFYSGAGSVDFTLQHSGR